jgi:hypothetical protein
MLFLLPFASVYGQVVKTANPIQTELEGMEVFVFPTYSDNPDFHPFYYLPVNMRVAEKNGSPEFSLITYRKDSLSEIEGGLLHFLLTWGLSSGQESLLDSLFKAKGDSLATLMGSIMVKPEGFEISTDKPLGQILKNTLTNAAKVPSFAGGKMALSFRLDGDQAKAVYKAIKSPKTVNDISLKFHFKYDTMGGEKPWEISLNLSDLFSYVGNYPQCVR